MTLYREYEKKLYASPVVEVESFEINDVIGTSTQDDHEGGIDSIDEGTLDVVIDQEGNLKAYLDEYGDEISQEDLDSVY